MLGSFPIFEYKLRGNYMKDYELTPEEDAIVLANYQAIVDKYEFYMANIMKMTSDKAMSMAKKHVTVSILRKDNPLYGHDEESLNDLYHELKSIEDAESGADREYDYEGTDEMYRTEEEIRDYVIKHSM